MSSIISISRGDPTLVNRYLADQLGEDERHAFEQQMLSDPEILREVEATARFKAGLMQLRTSGELAGLLAPPRSRANYVVAAAAVLAMLVMGIGLLRWQGGAEGPLLVASLTSLADQSGALLPAGQTLSLLSTRSQESDVVIDLPASRQAIELRVLPDSGDIQSRYRAVLSKDNAAAAAGAIEDLRAGTDGFVTLFIDSARLTPGRYRLTIENQTRGNEPIPSDLFLIEMRAGDARP